MDPHLLELSETQLDEADFWRILLTNMWQDVY